MAKANKEDANDHLRVARERTASRTHPGDGLTRQELAELVNKWVWDHHNKKVVMATANYIGRLERGLIRWPGKFCREALRDILSVPTDAALGFVNARARRAAVRLDDVDHQRLLRRRTALAAGALPVAALLEGESTPTHRPRRVGATDIEQTRAAKLVFQSWSLTYGGGPVLAAALGQLRWSEGLLDALCPKRLRPALLSAVGDLADTVGYIAMDAGAPEEARRVFSFALACAEKAKDWSLRATVLTDMAVQAIETGHPDEGLTLTELALVRADRLTATELSLLHSDRARALATMHRVNETLTAIGTADDHFAHSTPDNAPPFMTYYNAAFHAANTGHALFELAILGHDPRAATARLTAAVAELTTDCARPLARCQTKLASLTMATGDPLQAATLGHESLDAAGTIRSRATADNLRELSRYATAHEHLEEVAHLQHRITTLLVRTDSP